MLFRENKELKEAIHAALLNTIIQNAALFNKDSDYYQMRDENNNGWDIFYYGYANRNAVVKNARAQMVINGWQKNERFTFNEKETQQILDAISAPSPSLTA